MSRGADREANTLGRRGTLERGHGAPLEPLAQLGDALGPVGALDIACIIFPDAAEPVAIQAAKGEGGSVNGR